MATTTWQDLTEGSAMNNPNGDIDAYLRAQRKHVAETELLYQQTIEQAIGLREKYMNADQLIEKRNQQALLAMKVGEEEIAKLILQEKRQTEALSTHSKELYEQCQNTILVLAEELVRLREGLAEAEDQRDVYAARLEAARLQEQLNGRKDKGTTDTFHELEQRGREIGREMNGALRELGRVGRETLREAGHNAQQELRIVRDKLQHEWHNHSSKDAAQSEPFHKK
ncbi:PspA/IM30 family protein [compost metagenome]